METNDAVTESVPVTSASAPERRPDSRVRAASPHPEHLRLGEAQTELPLLDALRESVERVRAEPVQPSAGPLVFGIDERGCSVVQDLTGSVYGAGTTREEAVADFYAALDDRLAFLRLHEQGLSPRLGRELRVLERLFPGRR